MSERTQSQHYKKINRISSKRQAFTLRAGLKWMKLNAPNVLAAIEAEAEKRWPLKVVQRHNTTHDYSFVSNLKAGKP